MVYSERTLHSKRSIDSEDIIRYLEDVILHTNEKHGKNTMFLDSKRMLHSQRSINSENIIGCFKDVTLLMNEEHDKSFKFLDYKGILHSQRFIDFRDIIRYLEDINFHTNALRTHVDKLNFLSAIYFVVQYSTKKNKMTISSFLSAMNFVV